MSHSKPAKKQKPKKLTNAERQILERQMTIAQVNESTTKNPLGQRAIALNGGLSTYTEAQRDAIANFMEKLPAYTNPNSDRVLQTSREQWLLFIGMFKILPPNTSSEQAWDKDIIEKWSGPYMAWRISVGKRKGGGPRPAPSDAVEDAPDDPEDENDLVEDNDDLEGVDEQELLNDILHPRSQQEIEDEDALCESIFIKHGIHVSPEERVLSRTVYSWLDAHMSNVISFAYDPKNVNDTTVGARLWAKMRFSLRKRVHTLVRQFKLRKPRGAEKQERLDAPELDLLMVAGMTLSKVSSRAHYTQIIAALLSSFFAAFRPSSLVGTHDESRKISEMMCWRDVEFLRNADGSFTTRITIRAFKGHENDESMEVTTQFDPVECAEDLLFDPSLWYVCLGFSRGIFEKYSTIGELIDDDSCVRLKIKDEYLDKAVFLKGHNGRDGPKRNFVPTEPADHWTLSAALRNLCKLAGLRPLPWTAIRRATARHWKESGVDGHDVSLLMNHKVFAVIDQYYAPVWERSNVVDIRLGQSGLADNPRFGTENTKNAIKRVQDRITPALEVLIRDMQEARDRGETLDDKPTKKRRGPTTSLDLHKVSPADVEEAKQIMKNRGRMTSRLIPAAPFEAQDDEGELFDDDDEESMEGEPGEDNFRQLDRDAIVFARRMHGMDKAVKARRGERDKPRQDSPSAITQDAFKNIVYSSTENVESVRPAVSKGTAATPEERAKLRTQRHSVIMYIMHTMFETVGIEYSAELELLWPKWMELGHRCPLCIHFTHILPGESESAADRIHDNWRDCTRHMRLHSEWHDLELKMLTTEPGVFACPACGELFTSIASTRAHCIGECTARDHFGAMSNEAEGPILSAARQATIPTPDELKVRRSDHLHNILTRQLLGDAQADPALSPLTGQIGSLIDGLVAVHLEDV